MMRRLTGSGIGGGIVIGHAYVLDSSVAVVPAAPVAIDNIDAEIDRFEQALTAASNDLQRTKTLSPAEDRPELSAFLDAHILMIKDPSLNRATVDIIRNRRCKAEFALNEYRTQIIDVFEQIEDPYLRTKQEDVNQIIRQILQHLRGNADHALRSPSKELIEGQILVAHDLSPADILRFKNYQVGGFVTDLGSTVSHVAILAHSLQIPAVVGLHGQISEIENGVTVALDSGEGTVYVDPTEQMLDEIHARRREYERRQQELALLVHYRPTTVDGHNIDLQANVELPSDVDQAIDFGASGVGLYRTEYLFMNRNSMPDEEEQFDAYSHVASTFDQVTIRTLDLGADKQVDGGREHGRVVTNPALGIRAVRLCIQQPELFRPQLLAIYRASAHGDVRCMIPMLSSIEELKQVLSIINAVKLELKSRGADFNPHMPIGAMIEVPAAAISADLFAQRLDFLSIGTNDLIQYTLAIDRVDDEVNYLYDPMNYSVLRLIKNTIEAGARFETPVSMCGEMAGDTVYTRLLLGLGLDSFSINPSLLPEIKHLIRTSRMDQSIELASEIMAEPDSERRQDLLERLNSLDHECNVLDATA